MTDLGTIQKNSREEIRVTLESYQGRELVNLRVWFEADGGEYRPSKKGIAFRRELLPEVLAALGKALEGGAA